MLPAGILVLIASLHTENNMQTPQGRFPHGYLWKEKNPGSLQYEMHHNVFFGKKPLRILIYDLQARLTLFNF